MHLPMRGIHIFEKPYYREIRPMRGPPSQYFIVCTVHMGAIFSELINYILIFLLLQGVHSEGVKITSINHSDFTEKQGEAAKIICAINVAQKICVFNSPSGTPYGVIEGAK